MLITDDGTIIRMPVSDISVIGRVSQGVRVMRVEEGSRIVCVTATERDEDEQEASKAEDEAMSRRKRIRWIWTSAEKIPKRSRKKRTNNCDLRPRAYLPQFAGTQRFRTCG